MLLVANFANSNWCKNADKGLNLWHVGTHLRVLSESYPMNTNMTGFRWFSKCFASWNLLSMVTWHMVIWNYDTKYILPIYACSGKNRPTSLVVALTQKYLLENILSLVQLFFRYSVIACVPVVIIFLSVIQTPFSGKYSEM